MAPRRAARTTVSPKEASATTKTAGMGKPPKITSLQIDEFNYTLKDMGTDSTGFNLIYSPGGKATFASYVLQVHTDAGITGINVGWGNVEPAPIRMFAHYLIGKNALERERINSDVKRALRQVARLGLAPVDNALWDIAGKYYNAPLYELLGGHKKPLPTYASTFHGDHVKGSALSTPEGYADFAEECYALGYRSFKIHGWNADTPLDPQVEVIRAVGKRVGQKMALMVDPACELMTFGDALRVGWACDDNRFFWWEDPFRDGGISQFAHRKLRQLVKTPLLQTEHMRSLEPHVDFIIAEATDFVRGDVQYDGITNVMKLAHAAEGLGIDIEFHGPGPAQRHCMSAIRNTNYYEMALVHPKVRGLMPPIFKNGYTDDLGSIDKNGCVYAPDGPGLGVEVDWEWVKKNLVGSVTYK